MNRKEEYENDNSSLIRIVHLVSALHAGGIERLLLSMAPYWDQAQFSIEVWCLNVGSIQAYVDLMEARGVRVKTLGRREREKIEPFILWRLISAIIREEITIIHSHTPYPMVIAMIARYFLGSKVLHFHHLHSFPTNLQLHFINVLSKIKHPDCLISVSFSLDKEMKVLLPNIKSTFEVIHNGIELSETKVSTLENQLSHVFTSVRLVPIKNVELLLLAMQKVKIRCPEAKLSILGSGELLHSLQEKSRLLGIEDSVNFLGYVLEPEKYYPEFGVFVLPSLYEPFGLSLLEAMAWGKPCVSTDAGGTVEFLHNEKNGLVVPSNDPEAMADAIVKLIEHPALARKFGEEARKTSLELTVGITVGRIQELYTKYV